MLKDPDGNVQVRIHPNWRSLVQSEDLVYFQSVSRDFLERAKEQPEDLVAQIASLGVGPLVTKAFGANLKDHPELHELSSTFVEI